MQGERVRRLDQIRAYFEPRIKIGRHSAKTGMPGIRGIRSQADDVVTEPGTEAGRIEYAPTKGQASTRDRVVMNIMVAHITGFLEALQS